ncbi:MAG: DUF4278 domain-containing protein [Oculatellaceae cyanobacterium bins.114]|nr:DUF4278 domain-containing protein [Oculatellaceae cyanobacterium bins.114]
MKLIYRGNSYDYHPELSSTGANAPFKTVNGYHAPYTLTYRGTTQVVDPTVEVAQAPLPSSYDLIYRGMTYHVNRDAQGVTTTTVQAANKPQAPSKAVPAALSRNYIAKVHKANLLQNVQRRLQVARERGDQELVRMLEAELNQIAA